MVVHGGVIILRAALAVIHRPHIQKVHAPLRHGKDLDPMPVSRYLLIAVSAALVDDHGITANMHLFRQDGPVLIYRRNQQLYFFRHFQSVLP